MKLFYLFALTVVITSPARARIVESDGADDGTPLEPSVPDPDRYIVLFKNSKGRGAATAAASAVHLELDAMKGVAVTLPREALEGLSNNPNIELIEQDTPRYPMHLRGGRSSFEGQRRLTQSVPYGIPMVQADQISSNPDNSIKVCIIDSGYNLSHEDLPSDNVDGYNGNLPWAIDGDGHGTHVAGTIAALDNNVGVIGVVPGRDLYIVRVFGDNGNWAYSSTLIDAAYRCKEGGANIISMSLGCDGCYSESEETAFADLYNNHNILSIAAAGNSGNTAFSYPASYNSVVSVAAVDSNRNLASFSQRNIQVELAGPGVSVESTVPGPLEAFVEQEGSTYTGNGMQNAALGDVTGILVNCGLGLTTCSNADGKVCLIERGEISFYDKVTNCELGGGIGTIIYNNVDGDILGTLGDGNTSNGPAIGISRAFGLLLSVGVSTRLKVDMASNYASYSGTSMATPHVSGVAALVWSQFPSCTNAEIRNALIASAEDLGAQGLDTSYGYGLVQAAEAVTCLNANSCAATTPPPTLHLLLQQHRHRLLQQHHHHVVLKGQPVLQMLNAAINVRENQVQRHVIKDEV